MSNQPPRYVIDNPNVTLCPHARPLSDIQRDLVALLEAAARRNPLMWGIFPAYEPIERRYPAAVHQ